MKNILVYSNFRMLLTRERIIEIANETKGQRKNPKWHEYRKNRLTSSLFGITSQVFRTSRLKTNFRDPTIIVNEIINPTKIDHFPAIQYSIAHRPDAIKVYELKTGFKVCETGIWLFPNGILGATPEGLVIDSNPQTLLLVALK